MCFSQNPIEVRPSDAAEKNTPAARLATFSGKLTGLSLDELNLDATLSSGQVFRFARDEEGAWRGVIEGGRRVRLMQCGDTLFYEIDAASQNDAREAVTRFLRLEEFKLAHAAEDWQSRCPRFAEAWQRTSGVRLLRQEPEECFFSFLCASVAPIPRIGQMLRAVADRWGQPLDEHTTRFPNARELAQNATEQSLRDLGLGFRAARIRGAAEHLADLPPNFLTDLRQQPQDVARGTLTGFFGVGAKIADCVALFSLDRDDAIPVDTHIWRMARAWYLPADLAQTSLTDANYRRVHAAFGERFGERAGWAQQTLFYRAAVGGDTRKKRVA